MRQSITNHGGGIREARIVNLENKVCEGFEAILKRIKELEEEVKTINDSFDRMQAKFREMERGY